MSAAHHADLPRLTIITPSYNQGQFLEATLRSVLDQDYPHLEYMVIDGGSTDDSPAIIARYAHRLAYHVSEPDGGQAAAINKGLRRATGEVLAYLNSDDVLLPGALWRVARAFQRHADWDAVCGHRLLIDVDGRAYARFIAEMPVPAVLARVPAIAQETCFWRRRVTERIGLFDESLHFALDYDYWLRALKAGFRFHLLNRFLGGFRIHGGSKSSNLTALRDAELAQLYARHLNRQITHEQMRAEVRAVRDARWPFLSAATAEKLREAPLLWLMLATRRRLPAAHPPLM